MEELKLEEYWETNKALDEEQWKTLVRSQIEIVLSTIKKSGNSTQNGHEVTELLLGPKSVRQKRQRLQVPCSHD